MKLKTIISILLATMLILFAAGCEQPDPVPVVTEGKCILATAEDKSLVSEVNSTVVEYLYKATPQFSGTATGATTEWTHLSYGGSGTIGLLTQGKWKFDIQGVNSSGTVVTTGGVISYIDAGKDNVIEIQMKTDPSIGKGSISYAVWTQNVSEAGSVLKTYQRVTGTMTWTKIAEHSNATQENVRFNGKVNNLQAGFYDVLFLLFDKSGAALGGEQVGVQVVAGHDTAVSGIVEPSNEIGLDVTIKSMGYVHGILSPDNAIKVEEKGRDSVAYVERGDTITFSWTNQDDSSSIPTEWIWAVDGEVVSGASTNSYSVCYDTYGDHDLSVVGIRRDESGKAWDAGSAVMKIVVVRHICDVSFMAEGGTYSDGTDICIISQDTTMPEEREIPGGQPYDGFSPQRSGYILTGWKDAVTGEKVVDIAKDGTVTFLDGYMTKDETRTLKAMWEAGTYNLTVIWNDNVIVDGNPVENSVTYSVKSGEKLTMLNPSPSRIGFKFIGFTTEENGRGDVLTTADTYRWGKDITVYANWEYIPIKVSFYKSYSDYESGKSGYKFIEVGADLRYGSLPQPLRQGKVFKGWADPDDIDPSQYEVVDGHKYLTNDALIDGRSFVTVDAMVRKYVDHPLVSVWGEGNIKVSFDYSNAVLTAKGQANLNQFDKDGTGTYYKMGALGTMYGALPFTGIETEVREGWEFMGWYDTPSYSMRIYDVSAVSTMEDHTLYGKWEGQRLSISFNTGTSEAFPVKYVRFNAPYGTLPEPTRYGYTFEGWWYDGELIEEDTYVEYNADHTLTAKWKEKTTYLTVNPNGGTWTHPTEWTMTFDKTFAEAVNGSTKLGDTSTSDKLKNPTRYGYDFSGWFDTPAGAGERIKGSTVNKNEDAQTIYAIWSAHKHRIKFTYNWPGATSEPATSMSDYIAYGTSYGTLPAPTFLGYTFNGWFTANEGGSPISSATKLDVDNDVNVYGRWSIVKINVSFYEDGVICRDSSGTALPTKQVTWGQPFGDMGTPYKKGYRFTGSWTVVGQTDSEGNPIIITPTTTVTQTVDLTLSPIWEPLEIFIAVPYNAEMTTGGTVTSADWSSYAYRCVTFGQPFTTAKTANVAANGTWTIGVPADFPSWSRLGYYQDGWRLVVQGTSLTEINTTAMLWDYSAADDVIKARTGTLSPENMVWLVPNWKLETYQVTFVNKFYDGSTISNATGAPSVPGVTANYLMTLGAAMGNNDESVWAPEWTGYACAGFYADEGLTQKLSAESVFGTDITLSSTQLKIYVKWMKSYTEYSYSTDDTTRYPDNSRQVVFRATELFNGTSNGFTGGTAGWYSFSGNVDDVNYSSVKIRVGTSNIPLATISKSVLGSTAEASWTALTNMTIKVATYTLPYYTYTFKCPTCNGAGYVGYRAVATTYSSSGNGTTNVTKNRWAADTMYDFCPDGCRQWTSGSWSGYQELNNTVRILRWVTCPNCNGNPSSKTKTWTGYHDETWYHDVEHPAVKEERTKTIYVNCGHCPGCSGSCQSPKTTTTRCGKCGNCTMSDLAAGGASVRPPCSDPIKTTKPCGTCNACRHVCSSKVPQEVKETVVVKEAWTEHDVPYTVTITTTYNDICYCNKFGNPGKVPLAGYANLGTEYGTITVSVNGTAKYYNSGSGRSAYEYNNGAQGTSSVPVSRTVGGVNGSTGVGGSSSFTVNEGDVIKITASLPRPSNGNIIVSEQRGATCVITDDAGEFGAVALAGFGNGTKKLLNFNYYNRIAGKYATTNGTSITSPPTKYYQYTGTVARNGWVLNGTSPYKVEEESLGTITYNDINTAKTNSIRIVKTDGTTVTGSLQSAGDFVTWTDNEIILNFTKSGGGTEAYTFRKRQTEQGADNAPPRALSFSFWLKET